MAADFIRVNGNLLSWGSCILKIGLLPFTGITAISWDESRERAYGHGMGAHQAPRGRSRGKYVPGPLKMTCFADTAQEIIDMLAAASANGLSYGNTQVPITLQLIELDIKPQMTFFDRCCVVKPGADYSEGPDNLMRDLEWSNMAVYSNKKTLFDSSRGVP